jgi:hypothetical protein
MEGDGTAVKVCRHHNIDPSAPQPAVCLIDGDSKQQEDPGHWIFRLPGQSPESFIFDRVLAKLDLIGGELAVALLRPYEEHSKIADVLRMVRNTNRDPHLLYSQVGKALGLIPEARVREAFIAIWARTYKNEADELLNPFRVKLPMDADQQPLSR